jgi:NADPH-dependent 2,4-dienoyl-CoA reductase/sulfur reductase-like enzyme
MNNQQDRAPRPVKRQAVDAGLERADILIIGNGIAGITAALEARNLAPDKRIVVITNQTHPTINTPALKQFAVAKLNREQLLAFPAGTERTNRIHLVNATVEEIHPRSKYVLMDGKRGFGYDSLLLATGSHPTGLADNIPGRHFDGVLSLHRLPDYMNLRRRLPEVSEVVVVGGGVHAIETVIGMRYWGLEVHWLLRGNTFMRGMLDDESSDIVLEHMREKGVQIHLQTEIAGVVGRMGCVAGIITNQQEMIPCQMILSCIGTRPVTELADHSTIPIKHKNGIIVDDKLRTSVRDVYAAGDVAALRNPQTGKYETRALWYAAAFQGRIVGAMLAGRNDLAIQPFGVPWHATHLGELCMLTVGEPMKQGSNVVTLTDNNQTGYRRLAIVDNRLVGFLALGNKQPDDSLAMKRIVDEGLPIRDVVKSILKGQFDAREYLSKARSRVAEGMITTRQLPPDWQGQSWEDQQLPTTGLLAPEAPVTSRPTAPRQPVAPAMPTPNTEEMISLSGIEATPEPEPAQLEAEFNPFTGNLPNFANNARAERMPEYAVQEEMDNEPSPFTGNLPQLQQQGRGQAAMPAKETAKQFNPSGLWAYSAKMPTVKKTDGRGTEGQEEKTPPRKGSGLLSYTPQNIPARGGK